MAKELFGDTTFAYLVTPAAPLFGLDVTKQSLVPRHEAAYQKFSGDKSPGGSVAHEILASPQSDDAALDQAAGFTAAKTSPAAILQQLDLLIHQLRSIAANAASWVTLDKDVQEAITRAERRKQQLASVKDSHEAGRWNAQIREQLDIAGKCEQGLSIVSTLFHGVEAPEPRDLAWQIGTQFVQAAASSDLIVTARQQLDRANQRLLAFPSDWVEAQFRWIRRAILASQTDARTGKDDAFVKQLGDKETKLRGELMKVRDQLLTNPLAVKDELDRITKEMKELATGAATVRNMELCDEVFLQLKEAKSPTGWIRSLASNPVTGDHGNDRLATLAQRAEKFQGEWAAILKQWKAGDKQGAAAALDTKTKGDTEWTEFFNDVATLPDGSTLRISERVGNPGEVGTRTRRAATPGGEPPAPRAEEVAKAHGIDPAHSATFEALYQAHPREVLAFLEALRGRPDLANRLLARFGEAVLTHFKPTGGEIFDIHGEIEISAGKLDELGKRNVDDLGKLVELARNKGPATAYDYFETTSTTDGKPGARLRFRSRLDARVKEVVKNIVESLGIQPGDPRAGLFDGMSEGDATRLWDLFNERGYKNADIRKQATDWAFGKNPRTASELVAEIQFYDAEVSNQAAKLVARVKAELAADVAKTEAAKGAKLSSAEITSITRAVTTRRLGRGLDKIGPAALDVAFTRTIAGMTQTKTLPDGTVTTIGAEIADVAWKTNVDAQAGPDGTGTRNIGTRSDAELPAHVKPTR